ncbi:hypothetical protein B484DRAFT_442240 [Ochromonadaceae sp. CCMP2298]|nr:hypothetical protein B484DRAFT_442240 [Ochromonadaceae sp. CCMP2298]
MPIYAYLCLCLCAPMYGMPMYAVPMYGMPMFAMPMYVSKQYSRSSRRVGSSPAVCSPRAYSRCGRGT